MDQDSLLTYARTKYGVQAEYRWKPNNEDCVLVSPVSRQSIAIISKIDSQVVLDIRCGSLRAQGMGITAPYRVKSDEWIGIDLDKTPQQLIIHLLDLAFKRCERKMSKSSSAEHLIVVPPYVGDGKYQEELLPQSDRSKNGLQNQIGVAVPAEIRHMKSLYDYTLSRLAGRAQNFYIQGQAVAQYQDDYPYTGRFVKYFPTYHDLNLDQLRGYFTWRTQVRRKKVEPTSVSFVYLYLYELLNLIGIHDPLEGYYQLVWFQKAYQPYADKQMLTYMEQWLKDYTIYYELGEELVAKQFKDEIECDRQLEILINEEQQSSENVTNALLFFASYRLNNCPLYKSNLSLLQRIVKQSWHQLQLATGKQSINRILGLHTVVKYYPFGNAIFYKRGRSKNRQYPVDLLLKFNCQNGHWTKEYYIPVKRRRQLVNNFLHEIDRLIRQHYDFDRKLVPRSIDQTTKQAITKSIRLVSQSEREKQKPKIKIDFTQLAQIRSDASITRESLLTDEERQLEQEAEYEQSSPQAIRTSEKSVANGLDLTADELYLIQQLLCGSSSWQEYVSKRHLMINMLVDSINEKMFDQIGDIVIEFNDQNQPEIVQDYQAEITKILGG